MPGTARNNRSGQFCHPTSTPKLAKPAAGQPWLSTVMGNSAKMAAGDRAVGNGPPSSSDVGRQCDGQPTPALIPPHAAQRNRASRTVAWPNSVATAWSRQSFTRQIPPSHVLPGLRGGDLPLNTRQRRLAPAKVRPKLAMSPRSPGRSISRTSVHGPSPSAPVCTTPNIPATHPSLVREQTRSHPTYLRTPNLAIVPEGIGP